MNKRIRLPILLLPILFLTLLLHACNNPEKSHSNTALVKDSVAANIKMYSHVWDEIINKRNLSMFNDSNFTKDVVMHASPEDVTGIDSARAYYANYSTGFFRCNIYNKRCVWHGK